MPGEWITTAAVVAAARLFYGSAEATIRALVWRAAAGLLRTRATHFWLFDADASRSPAAGGATLANVDMGARLWLDLHDCLHAGAGEAAADWERGDFVVECGVVRANRAIVAGCRWFAHGVRFWGPDLPFHLDGTPVDVPADAAADAPPPPPIAPPRRTWPAALAARLRQGPRLRRRGRLAVRPVRRTGPRVVSSAARADPPRATEEPCRPRPRPKARPPPIGHGRASCPTSLKPSSVAGSRARHQPFTPSPQHLPDERIRRPATDHACPESADPMPATAAAARTRPPNGWKAARAFVKRRG